MTELNYLYFGKRDGFYYLEIADLSKQRDDRLRELFDEKFETIYYNNSTESKRSTNKIHHAKFWKDYSSALNASSYIKNTILKKLERNEFIHSIPDDVDLKSFNYLRNLKMKKEESNYEKLWSEHRKKYKCISAYEKVNSPSLWIPCDVCGLIPLVWSYNNGNSTACGCGVDDYNHFSISAESVMSYIKRNNGSVVGYSSDALRFNWNHWVKWKIDNFKREKEKYPDIW